MKNTLFILSISILLLTAIQVPAFAADQVLIGGSLSLSGKYSETSDMLMKGYRLWEKQINEKGGLLGREVKLVLYDDKSNEDLVRKNYRKLIDEDHADLLVSPYSTPLTLVAAEECGKSGYTLIASGASGKQLWTRGFRHLFAMYTPADRFFIGILDLAAREAYTSVSIVYEDSTFHIDVYEGARRWGETFGIRMAEAIRLDPRCPDYRTCLARIIETKPEVLLVSTYPDTGYKIISTLDKAGYKPKVFCMTILPIHPQFYRNAGPYAERIFAPSQWEPIEKIPYPGTAEFISDFIEFTGTVPSYHAGSAYASCQLLSEAVNATGGFDQELIGEYIQSLDTVTIIGRFKVDFKGEQIGHNAILIQWQDGKKEIVYPRSMQTAKPEF